MPIHRRAPHVRLYCNLLYSIGIPALLIPGTRRQVCQPIAVAGVNTRNRRHFANHRQAAEVRSYPVKSRESINEKNTQSTSCLRIRTGRNPGCGSGLGCPGRRRRASRIRPRQPAGLRHNPATHRTADPGSHFQDAGAPELCPERAGPKRSAHLSPQSRSEATGQRATAGWIRQRATAGWIRQRATAGWIRQRATTRRPALSRREPQIVWAGGRISLAVP